MNKFEVSQKNKESWILKLILFILIFTIIVSFIWIDNSANKQNEELLNDFSLLQQVTERQNGGEMEEVIPDLEKLQKKNPNDYKIAFQLGLAYLNVGEYQSAKIMYTRALDLFPKFVEDKEFMYQYAYILANNEELNNAKVVIEQSKALSSDEEYQSRLTSLLEQIEDK
ncbi:tetratricopeptide repeat protein [Psychrobacillus sp. FSL K6-1415]|uniref:tetratricopeptide repeat protein n=1 Tax=Psychrobacillus sp. FSL K6-1415 TaxID=2921544 RepID=UPI0030F8EC71